MMTMWIRVLPPMGETGYLRLMSTSRTQVRAAYLNGVKRGGLMASRPRMITKNRRAQLQASDPITRAWNRVGAAMNGAMGSASVKSKRAM